MSGPVDVLAVLDELGKFINDQTETYDDAATALLVRAEEAREAVAELIEQRNKALALADKWETGAGAVHRKLCSSQLRAALARLSGAPQ